jgi:hypothetical protein
MDHEIDHEMVWPGSGVVAWHGHDRQLNPRFKFRRRMLAYCRHGISLACALCTLASVHWPLYTGLFW